MFLTNVVTYKWSILIKYTGDGLNVGCTLRKLLFSLNNIKMKATYFGMVRIVLLNYYVEYILPNDETCLNLSKNSLRNCVKYY